MKIKLSDPVLKAPLSDDKLEALSRKELLILLRGERSLRQQVEAYAGELEEKVFESEGRYYRVMAKLYAPSSERSRPTAGKGRKGISGRKPRAAAARKPSERYPNAEIIEKHITAEEAPSCGACGAGMVDSGMTETAEYLTVIPKRYIIVRQHRHKYRCCRCHGDIKTTPPIPRLVPGSSYSDELVVDATLSKYCDLIPMERYTEMAARQGFEGLPPHSLIGASFTLAEALRGNYDRLRRETLATRVLLADETRHRMLEGAESNNWYLWGFLSGGVSCFYECHGTRSGEVATDVLAESSCEVLLTDVYSGYKRAVREANEARVKAASDHPAIAMAFCNAHARRYFVDDADAGAADASFIVDTYKVIYRLERPKPGTDNRSLFERRAQMRPLFEKMRALAEGAVNELSDRSGLMKAFNYFLNNYAGLTLFLDHLDVPIDNNASERMLRAPVVGRKTWYGTHSKGGAVAAAIHFSLVQSCNLVGLNPRTYYAESIKRLHGKLPALTPKEMAQLLAGSPPSLGL